MKLLKYRPVIVAPFFEQYKNSAIVRGDWVNLCPTKLTFPGWGAPMGDSISGMFVRNCSRRKLEVTWQTALIQTRPRASHSTREYCRDSRSFSKNNKNIWNRVIFSQEFQRFQRKVCRWMDKLNVQDYLLIENEKFKTHHFLINLFF